MAAPNIIINFHWNCMLQSFSCVWCLFYHFYVYYRYSWRSGNQRIARTLNFHLLVSTYFIGCLTSPLFPKWWKFSMKIFKIFPCFYITCNRSKNSNWKSAAAFPSRIADNQLQLACWLRTSLILLWSADLIFWNFELFTDYKLHLLPTDCLLQLADFKHVCK